MGINRLEGPKTPYRLMVRARRQGLELHWHRLVGRPARRVAPGASKFRSAYVAGLRGTRYRSDVFTGLNMEQKLRVQVYELKAAEHRRRIGALAQLCRTLEEIIVLIPEEAGNAPWRRPKSSTGTLDGDL